MRSPAGILLIKAHSMGIGDLLRSSAAWRALKNKWPETPLHLLMLSKHGGYASESFIASHHLLSSTTFITIKTGLPGGKQRRMAFFELLRTAKAQLEYTMFDMVIDCEPYGIKTALLANYLARGHNAVSVGIAQFPLRRFFYDRAAPSVSRYIRRNRLNIPMDYTERDFVVLQALNISRERTLIELEIGPDGLAWQSQHASSFETSIKHVVLNIGCGTLDALPKQPPLDALVDAMTASYQRMPFTLHLTGANFEKDINREFISLYLKKLSALGCSAHLVHDWAGQCTVTELSGLLGSADIVISSDSGPFHIAVALGVPTLGWFNFATPSSYHPHNNVAVHIMPSPEDFADSVIRLMS